MQAFHPLQHKYLAAIIALAVAVAVATSLAVAHRPPSDRCDEFGDGLTVRPDSLTQLVDESQVIVVGTLSGDNRDMVLTVDQQLKPSRTKQTYRLCPTEVSRPAAKYLVFLAKEHSDGWEVDRGSLGLMPIAIQSDHFLPDQTIEDLAPSRYVTAADVRGIVKVRK